MTRESSRYDPRGLPQWGTVDVEIKDLSVENPELKGSPLEAWSRSEYTLT